MMHSQSENTQPPLGQPIEADTPTNGSRVCIKVIGVGRCGRNAVEHLIKSGVTGVECIFANADGDAVNPALHKIVAAISGAKVLFIAAGLGGHTGGAYANLLASAAREMGIHTFGVVFTPFEFEGQRRIARAVASLGLLDESVNMMTVVSNDRLLVLGEDVSQEAAFSMANEVLTNAVRGMANIAATMPGLMASEGFFRVLRMPGRALIGCTSAVGPFRAGIAIARALECPLVAEKNLFNAKAVLILLLAAEKSLELGELSHARNIILAHWESNTHVVFETVCDNTLQDEVRVTVMVTGLSNALASQA